VFALLLNNLISWKVSRIKLLQKLLPLQTPKFYLLLTEEHVKFRSMYVGYKNFKPFKDTMKHLKCNKISQLTTKANAKRQQRGISHSKIQYFDKPLQVHQETGFLIMWWVLTTQRFVRYYWTVYKNGTYA